VLADGRATGAGFGFGLGWRWRAGRITGARLGTNVEGAATTWAASVASTCCALGTAVVTPTATTTSAAAATQTSRVLPAASTESTLNGSANSSWSSAPRARTGGIAASFGRGLI
jgi:hypothetical protein